MTIRCILLALVCLSGALGQGQQPAAPIPRTARGLTANAPYNPITAKGRVYWFGKSTVGPRSLAAGALSAAWGTAWNLPEEYGPHWEGFGKRFGIRLTGVSTGNAIEASLGAAWGEDPRYIRSNNPEFWGRVKHAVKHTFYAYRPDGSVKPAYARMAGNVGNNFLANTWRVESESSVGAASLRVLWGVLGRMAGNTFDEFWPDVRARVFNRK